MSALERPGALELLQREAERTALVRPVDAGDVRVQVKLRLVDAEEPQRDADELLVGEGAGDEVVRRGRALSGGSSAPSDRSSSSQMRQMRLRGVVELGDRLESADDDPGTLGGATRGSRGLRAQVAGCRCVGRARVRAIAPIVPRVVPTRLGRESQPLPRKFGFDRRMARTARIARCTDQTTPATTCARARRRWSTRCARSSRRSRRRAIHVRASRVQRSSRRSRGRSPRQPGRAASSVEGRVHLRWRFGAPTRVLLIGHLDTVWPIGTLARWPFDVRDGRATGPGVFDMKAGVVQLLFALAALESTRRRDRRADDRRGDRVADRSRR